MKKRKGQSTMEYTLLFAGITIAVIAAVNHFVGRGVESQYSEAEQLIGRSSERLGEINFGPDE